MPIHQQISERGDSEVQGFVGPLVINDEQFYRVSSSSLYDRITVGYWFDPSSNKNIIPIVKVTYQG